MANPRTIAKIQSRIQERAAYALEFEVKDPRVGFITITRVELSPDLLYGKIFYSVLGGKAERSKAQHMLDSAAGFIQRKVTGVLQMRKAPHLTWHFDDSLIVAQHLDETIKRALERDRLIHEQGQAPDIEPVEDLDEDVLAVDDDEDSEFGAAPGDESDDDSDDEDGVPDESDEEEADDDGT